MQPLAITITHQGGVCVLPIGGEIDLATSTQFATALTSALASDTPLVLDMSAVSFIGAQGVHVLLAAQCEHGVITLATRFALIPSPAVSRVLELTGAGQDLDLHDDLTRALTTASPNSDASLPPNHGPPPRPPPRNAGNDQFRLKGSGQRDMSVSWARHSTVGW